MDVFGYIYAVLHSLEYRQKYHEFLRIDYPRIAFVDTFEIFNKISRSGKKLMELYLMKKLRSKVKYDVLGLNIIESIRYSSNNFYINKT